MGNGIRAKSAIIDAGTLCKVRNFYANDCESTEQLGIIMNYKVNLPNGVVLYEILIEQTIAERNDLEIEIVQFATERSYCVEYEEE